MISQITYRFFQSLRDYLRKDSNSFTIRDTNEFTHKLENTNWDFTDQANNANDPNTAYNIFIDKYTGIFDTCFPFKTIKGKALNSFRKPWLTKSLLRSIDEHQRLLRATSWYELFAPLSNLRSAFFAKFIPLVVGNMCRHNCRVWD